LARAPLRLARRRRVFDSLHGQPGAAPNGVEIHPVLAVCFGKGCALADLSIDEDRRLSQKAR
jgi:hypothetical protein